MERKFKLKHDTVLSKAGDVFVDDLTNIESNNKWFTNKIERYSLPQILNDYWFEEIKEKKYTWEKCFSNKGYFISTNSNILNTESVINNTFSKNVFNLEKQAKSALAMAKLSHIISVANTNENGVFEEQVDSGGNVIVYDFDNKKIKIVYSGYKHFLWFRTEEIAREVYEENKELIHNYLMID